jgi:hypothetical protein
MSANFIETQKALNKFAKYVIQQSRSNLSKQKKNVSSDLYGSLGYDLNVSSNSFSLEFYMLPYGEFIDKGVSGTKKRYNTIYEYTNKKPPMQPLMEWAKARNIRLRDEKGKFKKGNYRTIGFILQKSIYEKGIKPSLFFTKPFEKAFDNLPPELIEKFGLDIDDLLEFTT